MTTETTLSGARRALSPAKQQLLKRRLQGQTGSPDSLSTITCRERSANAPLSFAQQRLWFLDQLAPHNPVYNISEGLHLKGSLDVAALEQSLKEIIRRHETVRTTFRAVEGQPVQVVSPTVEFTLPEVHLTATSDREREAELARLMQEQARKPFDLTSDLMLRATLVHLGPAEHILLVTMHHIASDAWSMGVLYKELGALYGAFTKGMAPNLPELPIQYQDFAVWQRQWLNGKVLDRQLNYWKAQLANAPDSLALPTDHARGALQTFRGARQWRFVPELLANGLKEWGRQEGATLFMTMLAGFQTMLHRYTQQTDILVGSPQAGRSQVETEGLIGFFINTLVLRSNLSDNPTFRELLRQVRHVTLDAQAHQDLPFEKLVMELRPERSSNQTPLFQVMFAFQSAPTHGLDLGGVIATPRDVYNGTAKFDLLLLAMETEQGLAIGFEYNRDLFEQATIDRMLAHYQILLEAILADPDRPISDLPLLSPAERQTLLVDWNNTATSYPRQKTVHQLFEDQVEQNPDAIALMFGTEQLSYRELNEQANQLAHYLRKAGVAPQTRVALFLDRSVEMVVGLLGILKAGAVYVGIETICPKDRLVSILEDLQAPVLLTMEKHLRDLPLSWLRGSTEPRPALLCVDHVWKTVSRESRENPSSDAEPESLAYVSFTSGSTGRPKGVCIPHRGVVRLVRETNFTSVLPSDVFLHLAPLAFDASTFEIWGPLLNGARLVVMPPATPSLSELAAAIQNFGVTKMWLTAGLFNEMVDNQPGSLRHLRQLIAGGDVLSVPHARMALEQLEHCQLVNGYGPTENTTFTCFHVIGPESVQRGSIPIGRPVSNTQVYVLDERSQPVPIGVPGEVCIGGDGLAQGYLNRPELTTEKFIPNPFVPGERIYKTGDLARFLPDGSLEFLGRIDQQLKIRGFRIELGEIECLLEQHPAVRQCVVTAREEPAGQKQLAAYYVAAQNPSASPSDLREFLKTKLPDYMLPAFFMPLPALPLTPNGKVNRSALPAPERAKVSSDGKETAPRDALETRLAEIWESVLGIRRVGATDHFFQLGGHSLLAVRLIAQIEKAFGKKLSVATIFQAPTVEQLAMVLRGGKNSGLSSSVVEIQPRGSKPPLFLVHGVGGGMFWGYTNLSRHLPDQPVYALRSRAMAGQEEFSRIEEMAAHYVADLRAFQPQGPYCLGGYCFGGNVAYEMAQQLRAQGQKVAFLCLINAGPPNSSYNRVHWTPAFAFKFLLNLCYWPAYVWGWSSEQRHGFIRWKLRLAKKRIQGLFRNKTAPTRDVDDLVDLSIYPEEQRKLWETHIRALMNYQPKPYLGAATLFRSRVHPLVCSFDPKCGWDDLIRGGVALKIVPGPHDSILEEPYVRCVAAELAGHLEKMPSPDLVGCENGQ